MCICWRVTEINYKMHGATIKIVMQSKLLSWIPKVWILISICSVQS